MYLHAGKGQDKNSSIHKPNRTFKAFTLKQLSGLTKGTTYLLAMYFLRTDSANLVSQPIMHVCVGHQVDGSGGKQIMEEGI